MYNDQYFMNIAIEEARKAQEIGEVPIGAVIVIDGKVVSTAFNLREKDQRSIAHAEILAIDKACDVLGTWRLEEATLYVTLEPCPMCAGAIVLSKNKTCCVWCSGPKGWLCGYTDELITRTKI